MITNWFSKIKVRRWHYCNSVKKPVKHNNNHFKSFNTWFLNGTRHLKKYDDFLAAMQWNMRILYAINKLKIKCITTVVDRAIKCIKLIIK